METKALVPVETIEQKILLIRGQKVMLDRDLAILYGVETKHLNRQVKRNRERFPKEFMFKLTKYEKNELVTNWHRFALLKHSYSALIPKVIMGLIEQKERVFDTAKGNTSGLPAMLPWYAAWTASLSLWKYGDVMGRNPLYRKELCFTSRGENSFFMITKGRGTPFPKAIWFRRYIPPRISSI